MKKFIDIHMPVYKCNLQCHYCYISQKGNKSINILKNPYQYSPEHIGKALSQKRLGGICLFNICGGGETLIPLQIVEIAKQILLQGHYVWIVTNGTITKRFKQFSEFPDELRNRLGFKMSFQYLELLRTNMIGVYFHNIEIIRNSGMSFSCELTANDETEPYIREIMKITKERLGAYCHVTIPRDEAKKDIPLLSKHGIEKFKEIWGVFESQMFDSKIIEWGVKRKEYCYAGAWSGLLNIGNGILSSCYGSYYSQNIFKDISKPINALPVAHCNIAHCFNGHAFLAMGCIPEVRTCTYNDIRNRKCDDGKEWLTPEMKTFTNSRLSDENDLFSSKESIKIAVNKFVSLRNGVIRRIRHKYTLLFTSLKKNML